MSDDNPSLPLGVPFIGGSDDPTDIVGLSDENGNDTSQEDADPGV